MADFHFYEPGQGHGLSHDPFKAIVAPRPIGWISSISPSGVVNLAPYSFFNAFSERPPIVGFSSGGKKDTQRNVEATGEFVANLATRRLAGAMNITSASVGADISEMDLAGLERADSRLVRPPRVAASPAALECKLLNVIPLKDLAGRPTSNTLLIGQVVGIHIDTAYLRDGLFDMASAGTIARCGYRGDYVEVSELFELLRPAD